jgi:FtsH-binding integral membrane protein
VGHWFWTAITGFCWAWVVAPVASSTTEVVVAMAVPGVVFVATKNEPSSEAA